jgi:iron complex outermembrane receptor protein
VGSGITLLGNAGRSARIPNLTELFGNSGLVRGNPELVPETATSWDVGVRAQRSWTSSLLTSAGVEYAYFSSELDDVIVLVPSSVNVFVPQNVAAATIHGHEVSARAALADRLLLTANYTHQDTRDDGEDLAVYRGNQLPGRPAHEAYLRVELVWSPARPLPGPSWAARLWPGRVFYDVNLIADNFLDRANVDRVSSRALHGVGLDVVLPWHGVRVAWELKNFTDDQTTDAAGFPLPGRATFVTVSYGFGAPRAAATP